MLQQRPNCGTFQAFLGFYSCLSFSDTLGLIFVLVQPDGWARGEREGYGEPCDVTSLSLTPRSGNNRIQNTTLRQKSLRLRAARPQQSRDERAVPNENRREARDPQHGRRRDVRRQGRD